MLILPHNGLLRGGKKKLSVTPLATRNSTSTTFSYDFGVHRYTLFIVSLKSGSSGTSPSLVRISADGKNSTLLWRYGGTLTNGENGRMDHGFCIIEGVRGVHSATLVASGDVEHYLSGFDVSGFNRLAATYGDSDNSISSDSSTSVTASSQYVGDRYAAFGATFGEPSRANNNRTNMTRSLFVDEGNNEWEQSWGWPMVAPTRVGVSNASRSRSAMIVVE